MGKKCLSAMTTRSNYYSDVKLPVVAVNESAYTVDYKFIEATLTAILAWTKAVLARFSQYVVRVKSATTHLEFMVRLDDDTKNDLGDPFFAELLRLRRESGEAESRIAHLRLELSGINAEIAQQESLADTFEAQNNANKSIASENKKTFFKIYTDRAVSQFDTYSLKQKGKKANLPTLNFDLLNLIYELQYFFPALR